MESQDAHGFDHRLREIHKTDALFQPAGGYTSAVGMGIYWQDGVVYDKRPNGALVETVILAAIGRLEWFERSNFSCAENRDALSSLKDALGSLNERTQRRREAGIEGTHVEETNSVEPPEGRPGHGA